MTVPDDHLRHLLDEQTRYYRERASTYDLDMAWDSDDPELVERFAPVYAWFADLPIGDRVLEVACGTGAWTHRLAARAGHVHAIDVAPEMIERAQARVADADNVTFEVADVYRWQPSASYDTVFFSFLLTHVPPTMASRFWEVVASSLANGGTAAFVDAAPHRDHDEEWLGQGVVRRTLRDGSEHRIVKVFPTPDELAQVMSEHGLDATVEVLDHDFLVGTGRRSTGR